MSCCDGIRKVCITRCIGSNLCSNGCLSRTFKFDIFILDKSKPPPKALALLLVKVLKQMNKLTKLVLVFPEFHIEIFQKVFEKEQMVFPHVVTLVAGPYCEFMVAMCPNVRTVSSNGWTWLHSERQKKKEVRREHTLNLIDAASKAEKVTRLEIMEWWTVNLMRGKFRSLSQS